MTSSCIVQKWCTCAPPRDPCGVRGVAAVFLKNEHSLSEIQFYFEHDNARRLWRSQVRHCVTAVRHAHVIRSLLEGNSPHVDDVLVRHRKSQVTAVQRQLIRSISITH